MTAGHALKQSMVVVKEKVLHNHSCYCSDSKGDNKGGCARWVQGGVLSYAPITVLHV